MIVTQRLHIVPLAYGQLVQYINNDPALDKELDIRPELRIFSPALAESIEHWIVPNVAKQENNFLYYTLWPIIRISDRKVVGDLCFKNEPDEKGRIEIGYGTYASYRNQGLMREAVAGIIEWANGRKEIKAITAEVNADNSASMSVLRSTGFTRVKETRGITYWNYPIKRKSWWAEK